jgi:hypothetical protein
VTQRYPIDPQGTAAPGMYGPGTLGRIEAVQLGGTAGYVMRIRDLELLLAGALARFEVIDNGGTLGVYDMTRFIETMRAALRGRGAID